MRSALARVAARIVLAAAGGSAAVLAPPALAQMPAAPGAARICFYRLHEPSVSQNLANIDIDDVGIALVANSGPPLCREMTPGTHRLSVRNYGVDANGSTEVTLGPSEEAFVKIVVADGWLSGGGGQSVHREAFSLRVVSRAAAAADLARPR